MFYRVDMNGEEGTGADNSQDATETTDGPLSLVDRIIANQVAPQLFAERLRQEGVEAVAGLVDTRPDAQGWTLTCFGCGRTAKLPYDPGTSKGLCPQCIARGDGLG